MLRSLFERFHAKITTIKESKDIDYIPLTVLVGNLQTYELGLTRIGKESKSKSMTLKAKSNETDKSSDDKDCKQSSSSHFKSQDKGKKDAKNGSQYNIPSEPKCFGCQGFGHMKHEYPTYLKLVGKSKALVTSLSDIELEIESDDNDDKGILNAFTTTVGHTKRVKEA